MNFDEFMQKPQSINILIQHQLEEAERLKTLCEHATVVYSDVRVQTSYENKHEIWLTKYIDSKQKLTDLIEQHEEAADAVKDWLYLNMSIEDASILQFRYVDGLKNREIAERLHYTEQTVKNKVSKAVRTARAEYEKGA